MRQAGMSESAATPMRCASHRKSSTSAHATTWPKRMKIFFSQWLGRAILRYSSMSGKGKGSQWSTVKSQLEAHHGNPVGDTDRPGHLSTTDNARDKGRGFVEDH